MKEIAKFDFFCKFKQDSNFKVKMARRSKVLKDLKNSLKVRPSNHKRFSDLVVIQKVVKKFNISDDVLEKAVKNAVLCKVIWIIL